MPRWEEKFNGGNGGWLCGICRTLVLKADDRDKHDLEHHGRISMEPLDVIARALGDRKGQGNVHTDAMNAVQGLLQAKDRPKPLAWISVATKPPKPGFYAILVEYVDDNRPHHFWDTTVWWRAHWDGRRWNSSEVTDDDAHVTHYFPLPDVPQEVPYGGSEAKR